MALDTEGIGKRDSRWSQVENSDFDIVIIGGGISGTSLFARMSSEGYKTLLIDKGDFSSATSQASGMMIWGGLLYMKNLDFSTVISLSRDRDNLISQCPSRIRPQYFYYFSLRRGWQVAPLVKAGLDFYRLLGGMRRGRNFIETDPGEKNILKTEQFRNPLAYEEGMLNYSDCRFVTDLIHRYDSERTIPLNYVKFNNAAFSNKDKIWRIELSDMFAQRSADITSKLIINATGPYCEHVNRIVDIRTPYKHVFSKGVYLAFRRPDSHTHPLIFEMGHKSDVQTFVPWGPVSLWGPTETRIDSLDEETLPTEDDVSFLLEQASRNLDQSFEKKDIISYRAGVRALAVPKSYHADKYPLELSRHYRIHLERKKNWIAVYGGKFTSGSTLASMVMRKVKKVLEPAAHQGVNPSEPIEARSNSAFPGLEMQFPSPEHCRDNEYCMTIDDYLRRRTNISQWTARNGLGQDNENLPIIQEIIKCLPMQKGLTAETTLEQYITTTDRLFSNITN
ncbi:MAG: FAD-dependent oxidoreductase [Gammaproteobacteria bacterium]